MLVHRQVHWCNHNMAS